MVYIKISEEFQNGAQELLNLFFPGNGFVFVDDIPEVSSCDILITLNIEIRDNGLDIKIRMRQGNRNLYSETARIDNETGAEKARTPVKVLLYNCLSHYTGRKLPWGSLTGIRPAKIVHSLLKEGLSPDDAYRKL